MLLSDSVFNEFEEIKTLEKMPIKWVLKASSICKKLDQSEMSSFL